MTKATFDQIAEAGGALLFRLVRSISAMECEETRCCGVTIGQGLALLAMDSEGQTTMREVAAALGVSAGTATRVVDNLVRDGLAERAEDPTDRRKVCVRAMKEGEDRAAQLKECYGHFWEVVFGSIPKTKLNEALAALETVAEATERAKAACCEGNFQRVPQAKEGAGG